MSPHTRNQSSLNQYGLSCQDSLVGELANNWLNCALKINDKEKYIFKLGQGEYVSPENIENIYQQYPFVARILLYYI